MKEPAQYFLIRESAWQSFLADTYTFGLMGLLLYLNNVYLGNHVVVAVLLIIFAIMAAHAHSKTERFENIEELKKYLSDLKS